MWCGFDKNLEQGARCKRLPNNPLNPRVFVEDFAAKLPTAPQFTVYASHLKISDLAKASTNSARTEGLELTDLLGCRRWLGLLMQFHMRCYSEIHHVI
jgi:hypothetical protein